MDRNTHNLPESEGDDESLSARRAWIEIRPLPCRALSPGSLSARRAWIEIALEATVSSAVVSRSPQGEHGMFLFLTVQGGFVHADIRFNFKNCYAIVKNSRIK